MPKTVFIGTQPSSYEDQGNPLPIRPNSTAKRIIQMMGILDDGFADNFVRMTVSPFHDPEGFSPEYWAENARNMLPLLEGRRVVLLGTQVAQTFGYERTDYDFAAWFDHAELHILFAVIPHPGGVNRLYNNPEMHRMVSSFLSACWELR